MDVGYTEVIPKQGSRRSLVMSSNRTSGPESLPVIREAEASEITQR
jgi:hypothetical protein